MMRKRMKRLMAIFIAGTLMCGLAGCGNTQSDTAAEEKDTGGEQANASARSDTSGDIYECNLTWPSLSGAPADLQMIEDAVNKITEPKIGVRVVLQPVGVSEVTSQQQLLISSGEKMDIVLMLWTGLDSWINTESLLELDELLPNYAPGIIEKYKEAAYGCKYNDHVYGVSTSAGGNAQGFMANSSILEKYGFSTEDRSITVEELEEIFATVKAGEGAGFYCAAGGGSVLSFITYDELGGSAYNGVVMLEGDDTKVVDLFETDEYKKYAERMYDWTQKGYISPDAATTDDTPQTLIATGRYLGAFTVVEQEGVKTSYGAGGSIPMTSLKMQDGFTKATDLTGGMFGIASTCEQPEKALALLNEIYTNKDVANILQNGIEGVHYKVVEENDEGEQIITFADGLDMSTSGYYATLNVWAMGANTTWSNFAALKENEMRAAYPTSPAFGYVFSGTDYSTELTALSAVFNEYEKIINCGAINPEEELPTFIEALKAAGLEKVIQANQEQYTKWSAEQ